MGSQAPSSEPGLSTLHVVPFAERSVEEALELGRALPELARKCDAAVLATSLLCGPAWLIGSRQRRVRFDVTEPVFRRSTTGTAAFLTGPALCHALALPRVNAVFGDATARTLLNRNVRGFLRGYRGLGVKANWGGREYVRAASAPLGLLSCDLLSDGSALVELWVGIEAPSFVTASGTHEGPVALREVVPSLGDPERAADAVARGVADKYGLAPAVVRVEPGPAQPEPAAEPDHPEFSELLVPIGRLEAAVDSGQERRVLLRGDVLSSNSALDAVETRAAALLRERGEISSDAIEALAEAPLDGARPEDVLAVLRLAAQAARH